MSVKMTRLLAVLMGLVLFAAACGGSSSDGGGTAAEVVDDGPVGGGAEGSDEAVAEAADVDDSEAVAAAPTSMDEWETLWATERQAIVDDIKANGYGVTDGVLTGPGGFTIDLSACPSSWSETEGINDGVIKIGHTTAQSGNLAAYGSIGAGMEALFEYTNANGGIGPDALQLELIIKDDAYVPATTIELVDELLQSEKPFFITTLGSPNTFAVRDTLNNNCVPQPLSMTGHQAWGDPEGKPWTTGLQLSYASEALLWGSWIENNLEGDVKVAALVMDNDFGLAYETGFQKFADASDRIEVQFIRHDPAGATLTNEVTTLAAGNPDVFISMTAGDPCVKAIQEAARSGIQENAQALFTPSVCKAVSNYMAPAEEAADNWWIIGGGWKDNTDPQYADDPYISWMNTLIADAGLDASNSLYGGGVGEFGWAHIQALHIAASLDGGLTRTNYMIAVRSLDMTHPALLPGIKFAADGNNDSYLVEGSDISQFNFETQSWEQQGGVIDLNGQSTNCAWVDGEGC